MASVLLAGVVQAEARPASAGVLTITASRNASVVVTVSSGQELFSSGNPFLLMEQVHLRSTGAWRLLRVVDEHNTPVFEMLDEPSVWPEPFITFFPNRPVGAGRYTFILAGDRPVKATLPINGLSRNLIATTPAAVKVTTTPTSLLPNTPVGVIHTAVSITRPESVELIHYWQGIAATTTGGFCLSTTDLCDLTDGRTSGGVLVSGSANARAYPNKKPGTYTEMADFETAGVTTTQGIVRIEATPLTF